MEIHFNYRKWQVLLRKHLYTGLYTFHMQSGTFEMSRGLLKE